MGHPLHHFPGGYYNTGTRTSGFIHDLDAFTSGGNFEPHNTDIDNTQKSHRHNTHRTHKPHNKRHEADIKTELKTSWQNAMCFPRRMATDIDDVAKSTVARFEAGVPMVSSDKQPILFTASKLAFALPRDVFAQCTGNPRSPAAKSFASKFGETGSHARREYQNDTKETYIRNRMSISSFLIEETGNEECRSETSTESSTSHMLDFATDRSCDIKPATSPLTDFTLDSFEEPKDGFFGNPVLGSSRILDATSLPPRHAAITVETPLIAPRSPNYRACTSMSALKRLRQMPSPARTHDVPSLLNLSFPLKKVSREIPEMVLREEQMKQRENGVELIPSPEDKDVVVLQEETTRAESMKSSDEVQINSGKGDPESRESTESVELVEPAEPVEFVGPTEPVKSMGSSESEHPEHSEPPEPTEPLECRKSQESPAPSLVCNDDRSDELDSEYLSAASEAPGIPDNGPNMSRLLDPSSKEAECREVIVIDSASDPNEAEVQVLEKQPHDRKRRTRRQKEHQICTASILVADSSSDPGSHLEDLDDLEDLDFPHIYRTSGLYPANATYDNTYIDSELFNMMIVEDPDDVLHDIAHNGFSTDSEAEADLNSTIPKYMPMNRGITTVEKPKRRPRRPNGATNECHICGRTFSRPSRLEIHLNVHRNVKLIQCPLCPQKLSRSDSLKVHMFKHTGDSPNKCPVCDRGLSSRTKLISHMRTHTGERPFECEVCGKFFTASATLKMHVRQHTGEKPYQCTICGKRTACPSNLKVHIRSHLGHKPFSCTVCNGRFASRIGLTEHMRLHTGEKPWKCDVCDKRFALKLNWLRHVPIHKGQASLRMAD